MFYALDVCLSGLFVGSEKCTSPGGVSICGGTDNAAAGTSRPSGIAPDHPIFEGPRKLGIHSSFMLAKSKTNQPSCGTGEAGGMGGIKASLGQSMSGTVGVTGLLQLPNILGGPPVAGSTWELIGPSGLACDLGGGRVHGCVVNLIGPTLHSIRHPKTGETDCSVAPGGTSTTTVTHTTSAGNSVGAGYGHSSFLLNHEKNMQSQIDVVHK